MAVDSRGDHLALGAPQIGPSDCCTRTVRSPQHRYQVLQVLTV
jgi:hypothetical protein